MLILKWLVKVTPEVQLHGALCGLMNFVTDSNRVCGARFVVFAYMTQLRLKLDNPVADNGEMSRFAVALGNELLLALSLKVNLKDCISCRSQVLCRQLPSAQSSRECA